MIVIVGMGKRIFSLLSLLCFFCRVPHMTRDLCFVLFIRTTFFHKSSINRGESE